MIKLIKQLVAAFGYQLVKGNEYDKLVYTGKHKTQARLENAITAIEMKNNLLNGVRNPVIVDVGAYTGQTAHDYLASFPDAEIFALEPTQVSYSQLRKKFEFDSRVNCLNLAVSDTDGEISFNINEFSPTNSILPTDDDASTHWGDELLNTVENVTVQCKTLDNLCHQENIKHIHILKLDVQGAELQVLRGASQLLHSNNISIIYLEIIFVPTYREQSTYYEIGSFLSGKGYSLYGMFNLTYDKRLKQADMLFYRNNNG